MSFASFSPEFVVHCRSPLRASLAMAIRGDATGASLWKAPTRLRFRDKLLFRCAWAMASASMIRPLKPCGAAPAAWRCWPRSAAAYPRAPATRLAYDFGARSVIVLFGGAPREWPTGHVLVGSVPAVATPNNYKKPDQRYALCYRPLAALVPRGLHFYSESAFPPSNAPDGWLHFVALQC